MAQFQQQDPKQEQASLDSTVTGNQSQRIVEQERREHTKPSRELARIGHRKTTPRMEQKREEAVQSITRKEGVLPVTARVLAARGFTPGKALTEYIERSLDTVPDKSTMKNFQAAIDFIFEAREEGKKVAVACDYDADGATSAAQLAIVLDALGVDFEIFATDRYRGGYGLKAPMIDAMKGSGCSMMIAVDIGTKNHAELALASSYGIESLVLDHHEVDDETGVPGADVFVNPHQAGCGFAEGRLCAAGITYFVSEGVREQLLSSDDPKDWNAADAIDMSVLVQLAGCGTIADMMELKGINRPLVTEAIKQLRYTKLEGLKALKGVSGIRWDMEASDVGFQMGPRINAAGRLIKDEPLPGVMNAVNLFLTDDKEDAEALSQRLHDVNADRRKVEYATLLACIDQIEADREARGGMPSALVVTGNSFHPGVVGIVASRLTEIYNRPAVVLAGPNKRGEFVGSARSAHGVHLADTLELCRKHLGNFGGHAGAAGCSVPESEFEAFSEAFIAEVDHQVKRKDTSHYVYADAVMSLEEFTRDGRELMKELTLFEPCGRGNPSPRFEIQGAMVVGTNVLKERHLEVVLRQGESYVTALLWQHDQHPAIEVGQEISLVARPRLDDQFHFNQRRNPLQLEILAAEVATPVQ